MSSTPTVRTRLAPSPTGIPHIGNTRTALFDYLLAKKYSGKFILRIEDTDQKRLVKESLDAIYEIMDFLQLTPDESTRNPGSHGPYTQTEKLKRYQERAEFLIKKGIAYRADGAVRIDMKNAPVKYWTWKDKVQGSISIPNSEMDDKVILKSDGIPTYHLAATVDDHDMEITHVLRGVEWISSTPVHLYLYQAFGWQPPAFYHAPLLLGPDKSKLSKRHGAKNVLQYRDEGYLPEAINNFLFYLGFSYKDNSDLLTLEEMAKVFDESKLQKKNAIFDIEKLNFFNSRWIKKLSDQELLDRSLSFISKDYQDQAILKKVIPLLKNNLHTLKDIEPKIKFFFDFQTPHKQLLLDQSQLDAKATLSWLEKASQAIEAADAFDSEALHQSLAKLQQQENLSPRQAFMTLRVAVTGETVTPPLFDIIAVLGKPETLSRLTKSTAVLS